MLDQRGRGSRLAQDERVLVSSGGLAVFTPFLQERIEGNGVDYVYAGELRSEALLISFSVFISLIPFDDFLSLVRFRQFDHVPLSRAVVLLVLLDAGSCFSLFKAIL